MASFKFILYVVFVLGALTFVIESGNVHSGRRSKRSDDDDDHHHRDHHDQHHPCPVTRHAFKEHELDNPIVDSLHTCETSCREYNNDLMEKGSHGPWCTVVKYAVDQHHCTLMIQTGEDLKIGPSIENVAGDVYTFFHPCQ